MTQTASRYLEAARTDVERLQHEVGQLRGRVAETDNTGLDSEFLETAWDDLDDQWRRLQAAGATASAELRNGFEEARNRVQKVLDAYRRR